MIFTIEACFVIPDEETRRLRGSCYGPWDLLAMAENRAAAVRFAERIEEFLPEQLVRIREWDV